MEGQYYFKAPGQQELKYGGGDDTDLDVCQVIFHPKNPTLSPVIPTDDAGKTYPPSGAGTAPASQAPTNTATPKSSVPMAIGRRN